MLSFLVQCQIDCVKIGRAWSPTGTERDMKISCGRFNAAVECGFFEKRDNRWVCTIDTFTVDHALMVVKKANEYIERKRSERQLRGHIPKSRKNPTPNNFDKQHIEIEARPDLNPVQQNVSETKQPVVPREITYDEMKLLDAEQFVTAFIQSIWVAECRRRGFGFHVTINTKIEL